MPQEVKKTRQAFAKRKRTIVDKALQLSQTADAKVRCRVHVRVHTLQPSPTFPVCPAAPPLWTSCSLSRRPVLPWLGARSKFDARSPEAALLTVPHTILGDITNKVYIPQVVPPPFPTATRSGSPG